ncbi:MAG: CHAT domain-containing protein, partial [Saprospiraceae bacterium]
MDVISLAFANDRTNPLLTLQEEDNNLFKILSPRQLKQHYILMRDSYASIETVTNTIAQAKDQLRIFLYSGHAGRDKLVLEGQSADAAGIAYLLGQCPNLQLVFLNGCSTKGQVYNLLQKGIPVIIATSAPIEDKKASEFSSRFFQAMNDQCSIKEAFELAKGELITRHPDIKADIYNILDEPGTKADESLWGLYVLPEKAISLEWKLNANAESTPVGNFVPNELLIDTLMVSLAPYREEIKKMVDDEDAGATKSILDKREAILRAIPHPVSEQLRKLLVDEEP